MTDTPDFAAWAEAEEGAETLAPIVPERAQRPAPLGNAANGRRVIPPSSRAKLDFIVENRNLGVTPLTMLYDGREVEVIAYSIEIDGERAYEPIAVCVDKTIEAALEMLPEPEPAPPLGMEKITLPDGRVAYVPAEAT